MDLVMFLYFNTTNLLIRVDIYLLLAGATANNLNAVEYVSITGKKNAASGAIFNERHDIARRLAEEYGFQYTGKLDYKREYMANRKDGTRYLQCRTLRYILTKP